MKKQKLYLFALFLLVTMPVFSSNKTDKTLTDRNIEVVINDIPFQTDKYLRIPYTLKTWQYEKEGLKLKEIIVLDKETDKELMSFSKKNFPVIWKKKLENILDFAFDSLTNYYLSIQLAIPLEDNKPKTIYHQFILSDSENNEIIVEGGSFSPRYDEKPLEISSPVKGNHYQFYNQSTNDYHFFMMLFMDNQIYTFERFATDILQLNKKMRLNRHGNRKENKSYLYYSDTLYAVGDATVVAIVDGREENNGNAQNIKFNNMDEYAGNYIILDLGNGNYATYAHCVPGGFMVKLNDKIKEGEPIALLGNSGNGTGPHLHFQINDKPEVFKSNGVPYVIKNFTKVSENIFLNLKGKKMKPEKFENSMMEQNAIVNFPK